MFTVPENDETTRAMARGLIGALAVDGQVDPIQVGIMQAMVSAMSTSPTDVTGLQPLTATELADAVTDQVLREQFVSACLVLEMAVAPQPPAMHQRVREYAKALDIDNEFVGTMSLYAKNSLGMAYADLIRHGAVIEYQKQLVKRDGLMSVARNLAAKFGAAENGPLREKWEDLGHLPVGTLGKVVTEFYSENGFTYPGTKGGVDPVLAQHDFVHVLADYATAPMSEIEVFTFISAASPNPKTFSYALTLVALFQSGVIARVPGIATANPDHLSSPESAIRFSEAITRGAGLNQDFFSETNFFEFAALPVEEARKQLAIPPKTDRAAAAGSVGAFDFHW